MRRDFQEEHEDSDRQSSCHDIDQEDTFHRRKLVKRATDHRRNQHDDSLDAAVEPVDPGQLLFRGDLRQDGADRRHLDARTQCADGRCRQKNPDGTLPRQEQQDQHQSRERNDAVGKDDQALPVIAVGPHPGEWRDEESWQKAEDGR